MSDLQKRMSERLKCGDCHAQLGTRGQYATSIETIRCYCHAVLEVQPVPGAVGPKHHDLTSGAEPSPGPAHEPRVERRVPQPHVQLVPPPAPVKITVRNRRSSEPYELLLLSCEHGVARVEWPMCGIFTLRKVKTSGEWVSSPRALLNHWALDEESEQLIVERLREDRVRRQGK